MYRILRHGPRIPGLPEAYSRVFPRWGMKFRHTSKALSCGVWWSQIWHCMHIVFPAQFWQAATCYEHMLLLQACLRTVYTHFALPLNDSFCSIPIIFSSILNAIAYTGLSRRRRCLVQPEAEMSCTVGDGDVVYGRRRRCLVWPETMMSRMAGNDCWLWYELIAFSHTGTFIYILALWPS